MNRSKEDIFDKLMKLPVLNIFEPFYKKNKEVLLYLFFGGLTFVVSMSTFIIFNIPLGFDALIANIISWIFAVGFAYITNRIWVFRSETDSFHGIMKEMGSFVAGRLATLGLEEVILFVFINLLGFNSILVKVVAQIVVIGSNYFISKLLIFKNDDR